MLRTDNFQRMAKPLTPLVIEARASKFAVASPQLKAHVDNYLGYPGLRLVPNPLWKKFCRIFSFFIHSSHSSHALWLLFYFKTPRASSLLERHRYHLGGTPVRNP